MTASLAAPASATAVNEPGRRRARSVGRRRLGAVVKYTVAVVSMAFVLLPMYVLVVTSFKPPAEVGLPTMWQLPVSPTVGPWQRAWDALAPTFPRTFLMAVTVAIISALLGSLNGYVLSLVRFRGADFVFGAILFGMYIPYQAVMVPLRQLVSQFGFPPGIPTLILVHSIYGIPIATLIFRNYYRTTVPHSLVEAAEVDGASLIGTLRSVILPISGPAFAVVGIWQFTMVWNDFLFAIFLTNTRNGPVILALSALAGAQSPDYAQSMAGALIASSAPLLVYVLLGKFFVGGLMAGSVKG